MSNDKAKLRVLIADDRPSECDPFLSILGSIGSPWILDINDEDKAVSQEAALSKLTRQDYDIVFLDIVFGEGREREGFSILQRIRGDDRIAHLPVVVLTNHDDKGHQESFMLHGVDGFLAKGQDATKDRLPSIIHIVGRSLAMGKVRQQYFKRDGIRRVGAQPGAIDDVDLYGVSAPMRQLFHQIARIATDRSHPSVMILGETGAGKTRIARAVWALGLRSDKPIQELVVNTIPSTRLEGELFGVEAGTFTGVDKRRGIIEECNGGTLFLDEIGDLPLSVQVKLLQVLRERKIRWIGGRKEVKIDFQLICATHQDLDERVRLGTFRADLYHRIRGVTLRVPTLAERLKDNADVLEQMIVREQRQLGEPHSGFTFSFDGKAMERLQNHSWPGNYAEFEALIRELYSLSCSVIDSEMIRHRLLNPKCFSDSIDDSGTLHHLLEVGKYRAATEEFRRTFFKYWIGKNDGNVEKTARQVGVDSATIYRKLKGSPDGDDGGEEE